MGATPSSEIVEEVPEQNLDVKKPKKSKVKSENGRQERRSPVIREIALFTPVADANNIAPTNTRLQEETNDKEKRPNIRILLHEPTEIKTPENDETIVHHETINESPEPDVDYLEETQYEEPQPENQFIQTEEETENINEYQEKPEEPIQYEEEDEEEEEVQFDFTYEDTVEKYEPQEENAVEQPEKNVPAEPKAKTPKPKKESKTVKEPEIPIKPLPIEDYKYYTPFVDEQKVSEKRGVLKQTNKFQNKLFLPYKEEEKITYKEKQKKKDTKPKAEPEPEPEPEPEIPIEDFDPNLTDFEKIENLDETLNAVMVDKVHDDEKKKIKPKPEIVKSPLDDLARKLTAEIRMHYRKTSLFVVDLQTAKNTLVPVREYVEQLGFYKIFPTSEVLVRSQKIIRHFNFKIPRDKNKFPLPFPYVPIPKGNLFDEAIEIVGSFPHLITVVRTMRKLQDEEIKLRSICRWVNANPDELPAVIKIPKAGSKEKPSSTKDIAEIFTKLCRLGGVQCSLINGYHRCYEDMPTSKTRYTEAKWCAVLLKGKWRFIDPCLPAYEQLVTFRMLPAPGIKYDKKRNLPTRQKYIKQIIGDAFFLIDPTLFISTHIPDDDFWQLLCRYVTRNEWDSMATVTPFFHYMGMSLQTEQHYKIKCNGGSIIITLTFPKEKFMMFATEILHEKANVKDLSFTYIESDLRVKAVSIQVYMTNIGRFMIHIFGKDLTEEHGEYVLCCSYEIDVQKTNADGVDPNFIINNTGRYHWGPADDSAFVGLNARSHVHSSIECNDDILHIVFRVKNENMVFRFSLIDTNGNDFGRHLVYWINANKLHIKITAPGSQKLTLHIYADVGELTQLSNDIPVCSYRVRFIRQADSFPMQPFPAHVKRLGMTDAGEEIGFHPIFKLKYFIDMSDETELRFRLVSDYDEEYDQRPRPVLQIRPTLTLITDEIVDVSNYLMWYSSADVTSIWINPSKIGLYCLSIFNTAQDNVESNIYNIVIKVDVPSSKWSSYPERVIPVGQLKYRIHEPTTNFIRAKKKIKWSYEIHGAHSVILQTIKEEFPLEQTRPNLWETYMSIGQKGTDVNLNVKFSKHSKYYNSKRPFVTLLKYQVIAAVEEEVISKKYESLREQKLEEHPIRFDPDEDED